MNIITIMNYPDTFRYNEMCKRFLYTLDNYNKNYNLFIFYENAISNEIKTYINNKKWTGKIEFVKLTSDKNPFLDQHNIKFKLYNLSKIKKPFIFIDSDTDILQNLQFLWNRKDDKPFIAIDHQYIPYHTDKFKNKFLNSGVQVVGDPTWYNYDEIVKTYYLNNKKMSVPGYDQAILYDYCKRINYDYKHPEISYEWNSCAGYTKIIKHDKDCYGIFKNQGDSNKPETYQVYINHYWDEFKPWNLNRELYSE